MENIAEEAGETPTSREEHFAVAVSISFHLTEGQQIDFVYPPNALDATELSAVAFSAFPDSTQLELKDGAPLAVRDTNFSFRIPRSAAGPPGRFLHGFVFCRQRQDDRMRRGGDQRSVVVLSPLPLPSLFTPLCKHLGPLCMSQGPEVVRSVFDEVAHWPSLLEWGSSVEFPLGPNFMQVLLPELSSLPMDAVAAAAALLGHDSPTAALLEDLDADSGLPPSLCLPLSPDEPRSPQHRRASGLFSDVDIFTPLAGVLRQLWTLWELMLLGEPLMAVGPTPTDCASTVTALVSLVAPFRYEADYRPYFTVHDPAFALLAAGGLPGKYPINGSSKGSSTTDAADAAAADSTPPPAKIPSLLGVTNAHIVKTLGHWPNTVSSGFTLTTQLAIGSNSMGEEGIGGGQEASAPVVGLLRRASVAGLFRRRRSSPASIYETPADAAWLAYRPLTRPDDAVLEVLVLPEPGDGGARRRRCAQMNSNALRQSFGELTRGFLSPLLPFITPTPPPDLDQDDPKPAQLAVAPPLPELDVPAFLKEVSNGTLAVPDAVTGRFASRADLAKFYGRFLESAAFKAWMEMRRAVAAEFQAAMWREAWRLAGGAFTLEGVSHTREVGAMEDYLNLEERLQAEGPGTDGEGGVAAAAELSAELHAAFDRLPTDVQDAMLLNPRRAELLKENE